MSLTRTPTMSNDFFPPRPQSRPTIYAYEDTNPQYDGLLKVGYTTVDARSRVAQQYPTLRPGKPPYRIVFEESAMRNDGSAFTDLDVHRMLRVNGVKNPKGEWFCRLHPTPAFFRRVKRRGQMAHPYVPRSSGVPCRCPAPRCESLYRDLMKQAPCHPVSRLR